MNIEKDHLYSIEEAVATLGFSRQTLYKVINKKQLKSIKIGRRRFFLGSQLLTFLHSQAQ